MTLVCAFFVFTSRTESPNVLEAFLTEEKTGVQSSLDESDVAEYLQEVMKEIKKSYISDSVTS